MRQWNSGLFSGCVVNRLVSIVLVAGVIATWALPRSCPAAEPAPRLRILVDARDLPRRLLHARITIPCKPGKLALWFPKWVHGTHEPCGPVQNIAGLKLHGPGGALIPWRRDELELYRFLCEVPAGATQIEADLDVICNEPAIQAAGYLSYGNKRVGMINWSNCLLYPEGFSCDDIQAELTVLLPENWVWAPALKSSSTMNMSWFMSTGAHTFRETFSKVGFGPLSLTELVDRPLVGGVNFRSIPLDTGSGPPAFLDIVSDSPAALDVNDKVVQLYSRVVQQAQSLFGACHYPEFHFLIVCSDELGYFGLEHLTSSINGLRERDLVDEGRLRGWVANLIPHEYAHSWCGKFRRPAGMCTPDFQSPQKTALLWVYEGLGEYLGELLMVRSGLIAPAEYRRTLAATIGSLSHREGRRWRSLEDTAISTSMLRGRSPNWDELRRDQDYYFEGMLVWLEADAIIREQSKGKKSLDDFCREFFGPHSTTASVAPYDEAEIVRLLNELADFDWESFFARRVHHPMDSLPLDVVTRLGYRASYTSEPFAHPIRRGRGGVDAMDSLGVSFDVDGRVLNLVPGKLADQAKLGFTTKVVGVNGKTLSDERFQNALKDSTTTHKIELLVVDDDAFKTVVLDYSGGPRHFDLARDPARPDLLAEIAKPRAVEPAKTAAKPALEPPKGYVCFRALDAIKIDGNLDEESWKAAPWTDAFVDIEGDVRPRPRFQTRAKMLWDDRYFYVAAQLDEPHVWGTLTKHDSVIFHNNDFEIFIDPDGDNHEYYEMEINALNTEWDLFLKKPYRDGGPAQNEWEIPGLLTGVHVNGTLNDPLDLDAGWTVEFAIPWKVLAEFAHRATPIPVDGDQWRINFSRVEWRHMIKEGKYEKVPNTPENNWVWSPQGAIDMHRPERWGFVQFSFLPVGREGATFKLDPSLAIRDQLMEIYQAQRTFHDKNKRWATTVDELKPPVRSPAELHLTKNGYRAEIKFTPPGGPASILSIEQDSRIQSRPANSPDATSQSSPK